MLKQERYPFVPGSAGINFHGRPTGVQFLESGSGTDLQASIRPDYLHVHDLNNPDLRMTAGVHNGTLQIDLKTVSEGKRHEDLFAASFVRFALSNLIKAGIDIDLFTAEWHDWSDNYRIFMENLKNGSSLGPAASDTWTGRLMGSLGFEMPTDDDVNPSEEEKLVTVIFPKR